MFKARNPNAVSAKRAVIDAAKPKITAHLQSVPGKAAVTFEDLRQAVPDLRGEPDGVVHQALRELGVEVFE